MIDTLVETTEQENNARIIIDLPDQQHVSINVHLFILQSWINNLIARYTTAIADPANKTAKNQMMRVSLNSALIAIGPGLAKMFWQGEGEPPRPGRKDDLMQWYVEFVAGQIIEAIRNSKTILHLDGYGELEDDESTATISIHSLHTEPAAGHIQE